MKRLWLCAPLLATLVLTAAGRAVSQEKKEPAEDKLTETRHSLKLGMEMIEYRATAGTLTIKEEDGKAMAQMFFVAYTRDGFPNRAKRPILFAFNGGPGSASVWLHMGAFGPRSVVLKDDGQPLPPPGRLAPNEFTLLDVVDLVFIDPVSTGYSRPAKGQDAKQFHGVEEDIRSVGEFIRQYCTRFDRWKSPKYIAGESYGTTRAAGLSQYLQDKVFMNVNGVLLISSVLNFQTLLANEGNDLPYPLFLPSMTATAWYHKKLSPELQADRAKTLAEVEAFALGEYTTALTRGDRLGETERRQVVRKLAQYTGLSEEYVDRSNLRVEAFRFMKELLRKEKRTVGRYDSRFTGIDLDAVGDHFDYDPSHAAVVGSFTAMVNDYLREELKYQSDSPYAIRGKVQPWKYGPAQNRYLNTAPDLREALTRNRALRVFVASGFYDLATPYFATDYTLNHLGLDPSLRNHVTAAYYDAGHMMYIDKASHRKLRQDIGQFLHDTLVP
jgi:carboxypeptidase C (cathepsin A)